MRNKACRYGFKAMALSRLQGVTVVVLIKICMFRHLFFINLIFHLIVQVTITLIIIKTLIVTNNHIKFFLPIFINYNVFPIHLPL